jgi:hypothetical protein
MKKPLLSLLLFFALVTSCAPTPVPVYLPTLAPTLVGFISASVETVDTFYKNINGAQSEADVLLAFNLLTTQAMGNPKIVPLGDVSKFQDKWWKLRVSYKLYDCGANVVFAEEIFYPRSDSSPVTPTLPHFLRFDLMQSEEGILISNITLADAPGEGCVLVLEQ